MNLLTKLVSFVGAFIGACLMVICIFLFVSFVAMITIKVSGNTITDFFASVGDVIWFLLVWLNKIATWLVG